MKKILLLFSLISINITGFSQSEIIDSLWLKLKTQSKLQDKCLIKAEIARHMCDFNIDSSRVLLEENLSNPLLKKNSEAYFNTLDIMGGMYWQMGKLDSCEHYWNLLQLAAIQAKDDNRYCGTMKGLALLDLARGDYDAAYKKLDKAITIAVKLREKTAKETNLAKIYGTKASGLSNQGKNDSALYYYRKAIPLNLKYKQVDAAGHNLWATGQTLLGDNQLDAAITYFIKGLKHATKHELRYLIAKNLCSISETYYTTKNYSKALEYGYRAIPIAKAANMPALEAQTLKSLGTIHLYNTPAKLDSAIIYFKQVLKIGKTISDDYSLFSGYYHLAEAYNLSKNFPAAELNARGAKNRAEIWNLDYTSKEYRTLMGILANSLINQKKFTESNQILKKILEASENEKDNQSLCLTHSYIATYFEQKGEPSKSIFHLKESQRYRDSVVSAENIKALNDATTKYETEKKEAQNKLLLAQNAEQTALAKSATLKKRGWSFAALAAVLIALFSGLWFNQKKKATEQTLVMEKQKFAQQIEQQENKNLQAILDALEEERTRIAQDIHDRIGAGISTAKLYFEGMKELVGKGNKQVEENFKHVDALLATSINELRKVSHNMVSGVLADFGLIPALQDLQETIQASGKVSCSLDANLDSRLDKNIEINLYRIVQELISNSIKYANCSQIDINLIQTETSIVLEYQDNGIGFDPVAEHTGIGHKNIKARLDSLAGSYENSSKLNNGAQYSFTVPV